MNEHPIESLPASWQETIRELRRENQQLRQQRNEARDALASLSIKLAGSFNV
jgi:hypothetical protein